MLVADGVCHDGKPLARRVRSGLTACLVALLAGGATATPRPDPGSAAADTTRLRVGEVRLDLRDIFTDEEVAEVSGANRLLRRAMNGLHASTRPWVVRQELLFAPGDPFDPRLLEESERNLRALGILNEVAIVPVDTTDDGEVDVVVRTRETWTLGLGVNFSLASGGEARWRLALTEQNFLGTALLVRGAVGQDLDADYGRIYVRQNRALRSPLTVELNVDERSDGFDRWAALAVPFRSDDQTWQFKTRGWERLNDLRWYLSNAGPAGTDPARGASLHALLPRRSEGFRIELARRVSPAERGRIWRVGAAWHVTRRGWDLGGGTTVLSDGRVVDLGFLAAPGQPLARETGTRSWPHVVVYTQGREWTTTRFLQRYGTQEDIPLGPFLEFRAGPYGAAVGSTAGGDGESWLLSGSAVNWERLGRAYLVQQVVGSATLASDEAGRTHELAGLLGWYQRLGPPERPLIWKTFVEGVHADALTGTTVPVLGLDRGLRTLDVDGMAGDRLVRWNTEVGRVLPWQPLGLARIGWGLFYGGGMAWFADEDRTLADARHEVGVGLRVGATRSASSDLARLDLTWDLDAGGLVVTTTTSGAF
jgi:hypothetical protein